MASRFGRDGDLPALLSEAIDAAISIVGGDAGFIATFADMPGALKVAAHRGCTRELLDASASAPLGRVLHEAHLARRERIVVEDMRGGHALGGEVHELLRTTEIRAFQSTPIESPSGQLVGLLSTHHRQPRRPQEKESHLLDLVARQCGDAIDRTASIKASNAQSARSQADKLRETEELFRTTVENIPVNLILYERDGRVVYLNPALARVCEAMCKRPLDEIIGRRGGLWPEAIWVPLSAHTERAIATRERQVYELALETPGGQRSVRHWTVVPLGDPDGEVRQILAMSHDITARRRLVDSLREADQRKSEFIALLSHELRNPLAAIRLNLDVLGHPRAGKDDIERARTVIDRQVGHLTRMVDDLLDLTRIAEGKIRLQRRTVDLNQLVREATEDNLALFEAAGVGLTVELADRPLLVQADGARVSQVVTNLLANAEVHGRGRDHPRVRLCRRRWQRRAERGRHGSRHRPRAPAARVPALHAGRPLARSKRAEGSGWAWRWSRGWPSCTAATCAPSAPATAKVPVRRPASRSTSAASPGAAALSAGVAAPLRVLVIEDEPTSRKGCGAISRWRVTPSRSRARRGARREGARVQARRRAVRHRSARQNGNAVARALRADAELRSTS